jgi:hypothetical protein
MFFSRPASTGDAQSPEDHRVVRHAKIQNTLNERRPSSVSRAQSLTDGQPLQEASTMGQDQWPYQEVARYDVSVSEIQLYDMLTYDGRNNCNNGRLFLPRRFWFLSSLYLAVPLRFLVVAGSFLCGDKSPPCMYIYPSHRQNRRTRFLGLLARRDRGDSFHASSRELLCPHSSSRWATLTKIPNLVWPVKDTNN